MFRLAIIFVTLIVAISIFAAFEARNAWIREKIAALSSLPSPIYASANAMLPPKGTKPRIVLIGDSRIAQWPVAALAERWDVINRGIGGETAAQLALRFYSDAIALDPNVIVIEAGVNDLVAASFMEDTPKLLVARNTGETLRKLAGQAASLGHRVLVATIIPPARPDILRLPVWKESLRDLVAEVNANLMKSRLPDGASLIDLSSVLLSDDGNKLLDAYRQDTLHINQAGYERLTATLIRHLQSTLEAEHFHKR